MFDWRLVGERRALSLFALGFMTTIFVIIAMSMGGAWARCFYALALVYGVAFFGVAAEWFWGRWYALGIGASGLTMAVLGLVTGGWNPALLIWGVVHSLVYLPLLGESVASRYENRTDWRDRYGIDDYGVARLKRAVKGAAAALPTLVLYALAPREGGGVAQLWLLGVLGLGCLGTLGLLRLRFWGVALLGAALLAVAGALFASGPGAQAAAAVVHDLRICGAITTVALLLSVSPFVVPAYRFLRRG